MIKQDVQFAARRVTVVMKLLEMEMPETMAAMRMSSLEISDCIEEFTGLGSASLQRLVYLTDQE